LLATQGATVAFSYLRNADTAEAVAQSIRAQGGQVSLWQADAHDMTQVRVLVQRTADLAGHLDIVVHSVPPNGQIRPFLSFAWEDFVRGPESELKAAFVAAQAVLPLMSAQHAGRLVYITSGWAKYPNMDGLTSLAPAFGALVSLTRALAKEFGPHGITVNTVAPGMVETDLSAQMPLEVRMQIAAMTPLGRIATPDDVAQVIGFLASDASRFMTGTYLPVSGGLAMD